MSYLSAEVARRRHWLERLTVGLILAHVGMAGAHVLQRTTPTAQPSAAPDDLEPVLRWAAMVHWSGWHLATAVALAIGIVIATRRGIPKQVRHRAIRLLTIAANLSLLLWLAWGALVTAWALWSVPPASLTTPLLLAVFAVPVSRIVSEAWIDREE